jgi:hypothetical protein
MLLRRKRVLLRFETFIRTTMTSVRVGARRTRSCADREKWSRKNAAPPLQADDGRSRVKVRFEGETAWLSLS